jgi:DsbC/DsbD-like thiol-disulfide interchange protein
MLKKLASAALAALIVTAPATADSGGFSPKDVANIEILPGWRTETGTYMTALRVTLAPGWKTYWRAPGDAGIPPRFDWAGSRNLSAVRFHWPAPSVFEANGMRTVGYKNELILPIELTPRTKGKDIAMRAEVELGVCEDICVPMQVRVSADLKGPGASDARIKGAIAARPSTGKEAGLRGVKCGVEPISDGLRLTAHVDMPSLGRDEIAIFELPDQTIWVSEASVARSGRTLTATSDMVPPNSAPFLLDRSQVRITVIAGSGQAVDIMGCAG